MTSLRPACIELLSSLAHAGHSDAAEVEHAFNVGLRGIFPKSKHVVTMTEPSLAVIDGALDVLDSAVPKLKRRIVKACVACVLADRQVTIAEAELLRAVADSLGCPVPPLLPGMSG